MKVISLHQPWASLLVTRQPCDFGAAELGPLGCRHPMVKRFETRSWPCPPSIIGQHVAFASTKRKPTPGEWTGEWVPIFSPDREGWIMRRYDSDEPGRDAAADLPLGCVVGSGVITASYPIFTYQGEGWADFVMSHDDEDHAYIGNDVENEYLPPGAQGLFIRHHKIESPTAKVSWSTDISDQLPYGDWTAGRFAWEITDVVPLAEAIPCVGKQGFWNWEPA